MSVAFDAEADAYDASDHNFGEAWTGTITVGSLVNGILVVMMNTITTQPSAISLDGASALTLLGSTSLGNGSTAQSSLWYILNPSSGSHTITVTSGDQNGSAFLSSWSGVSQTSPFGTVASDNITGTGSSILSVTGTTGSVLMDFFCSQFNDTNCVPAAGQTRLGSADWNGASGGAGPATPKINASYKAASSGNMEMDASGGASINGVHIGVALMPAVATPPIDEDPGSVIFGLLNPPKYPEPVVSVF